MPHADTPRISDADLPRIRGSCVAWRLGEAVGPTGLTQNAGGGRELGDKGARTLLAASLLLVVRPGAPSSVLAPSSKARSPSSVLVTSSDARTLVA